jgi:hypothetical protein
MARATKRSWQEQRTLGRAKRQPDRQKETFEYLPWSRIAATVVTAPGAVPAAVPKEQITCQVDKGIGKCRLDPNGQQARSRTKE